MKRLDSAYLQKLVRAIIGNETASTALRSESIATTARVRQCRDGSLGVHQRRVLDFSRRGKPTDNAVIESFNGRFREECLNVHWFASIEDAQQKIEAFRWDDNEHHPHRSLKGLSPREFAERMPTTAAGSLT